MSSTDEPGHDGDGERPRGVLVVRGVALGAGRPAVIVPLTATDRDALLAQAEAVRVAGPDVVEWRADLVPGLAQDPARLAALGVEVAAALAGLPLLVTVRSRAQGGAAELSADANLAAVRAVLDAGCADLLDVEVLQDPPAAAAAVAAAHAAGVPVVGSQHDWRGTPSADELAVAFARIADAGADVLKVAVTPNGPAQVLTLLAATQAATVAHGRPVIGIAMGELGLVSRVAGGAFGSAATFATVGRGSAPGQPDLAELRAALDLLHGPRPGGGRR